MFRLEHNVTTGEIVEIALTVDEIAELQTLKEEAEAAASAQAAAEAAKAAEKAALLERLGITAEEAKLLLS